MKIAEGHLKKVRKMVEDDLYCLDVIQQSTAVQKALSGVDELILEGHLRDCVSAAIQAGSGDKEIKEVIRVFRKK